MSTHQHLQLKVVYTGALEDLSGYADAARENVKALDLVGVIVAGDSRTFEPWKPQNVVNSIITRRLYSIISNDRVGQIQIIHLTPDNYPEYKDIGRYKVGYFAWETSRLPKKWVQNIEDCVDEIWVPSKYLLDISKKSGISKPIYVFPHTINGAPKEWISTTEFSDIPNDKFKFCSIFQWSHRKGADILVRAYYQEFSKKEPVVLILKTYRRNTEIGEKDFIRREISKMKRSIKGLNSPPIILIEEFLSQTDILSLYSTCDCYVSAARSEGFGIPAFSAASFGKPIIAPNYSAFPEHMTEENAYLIDVPTESKVQNMSHISPLYSSSMLWGEPSVQSLRKRMREVFENQEEAKRKGLKLQEYIKKELSYEAIGKRMKKRIEEILISLAKH